ncbi:energy transducer TonB [Shewanella subflava]|uniref:TonB family protein n=1 Tax=Shewanella subflava TaxID=2986476 RepID=A0ABT3IA38_9GAMM|nr:energy transducer TonB [Shewanella subflava]MCW3172919.1 TonB family protein [Shewanella subflava]
MTPKRYFAFGCLTILIQGGVLASQNSEPTIQLSEGSAMGANQAVSIMIAMKVSSQASSNVQAPIEVKPISKAEKPIEPVKNKPVKIAKPVLEPVEKPQMVAKLPRVKADKKAPLTHAEQPKALISETAINLDESQISNTESNTESNAVLTVNNQQPIDSTQGVTQETVALPQPTFLAPPVQPNYPKKARKRGFEGTVTVEVMFNQIGEQLSLTLVDSSGYSLLDTEAINAVKQWQFAAPSPQTALAYTVRVPVKFALN